MDLFKKIPKAESTLILNTFRSYTSLGIGLPKAIELLSEEKDESKLFKKLNYLIQNKNTDPAEALVLLKVIDDIESFILQNSKSTKSALDNILIIREKKILFEVQVIKIFLPSFLWFFIVISLVPFVSAKILLAKSFIVETLQTSKNIDISNEIILPFYTDYPYLILTIPYLILFIFLLFYIKYNYSNHYVLYKFFKTKVYSDAIVLFKILNILKSTGASSHTIFDLMIKNNTFKNDTLLLRDLLNSNSLYDVFEKYNYPKDIVKFIKMGEQTKSFWSNLPKLIEFCNYSSSNGIESLKLYWERPIYLLSIFTAIFFILSVLLLAINGMNFMLQLAM